MAKPFDQLNSKKKIERYFRKTRPWKRLPEDITKEITKRLSIDMAAFEKFLNISVSNNMVENNYLPLCGGPNPRKDKTNDIDFTLMMFAQTLFNSGNLFRDRLLEIDDLDLKDPRTHDWLETGKMCYESAVALEPYYLSALYQLAIFWGGFQGNYREALKYCKEGFQKIRHIQTSNSDALPYYARLLKKRRLDIDKMMDEFKKLGTSFQNQWRKGDDRQGPLEIKK